QESFFVYILQSLKDFSFYVGQCNDLDHRMPKHFDGMSKYTSTKRPLRLVYFEAFNTRSEAIKREKGIELPIIHLLRYYPFKIAQFIFFPVRIIFYKPGDPKTPGKTH